MRFSKEHCDVCISNALPSPETMMRCKLLEAQSICLFPTMKVSETGLRGSAAWRWLSLSKRGSQVLFGAVCSTSVCEAVVIQDEAGETMCNWWRYLYLSATHVNSEAVTSRHSRRQLQKLKRLMVWSSPQTSSVTAVICSEVSAPDALLIRWVTNTNKVKPPTQWDSEVKVRFMPSTRHISCSCASIENIRA